MEPEFAAARALLLRLLPRQGVVWKFRNELGLIRIDGTGCPGEWPSKKSVIADVGRAGLVISDSRAIRLLANKQQLRLTADNSSFHLMMVAKHKSAS